jgi:hypothetical protein
MSFPMRRALLSLALSVAVILLNPFGLRDAADDLSRNSLWRITSDFYRLHEPVSPAVVVLIDADSLTGANQVYPPSHSYYSRLIREIVRAKSEAIFVDMLLIDERHGTAELAQYLRMARDILKFPVFLGSSVTDAEKGLCVEQVLKDLRLSVSGLPSIATDHSKPALYKLRTECRPATTAASPDRASTYKPSAALEMYSVYCARSHLCAPPSAPYEAFSSSLVVRWGTMAFDLSRHQAAQCVKSFASDRFEAAISSASKFVSELFGGKVDERLAYPCGPATVVYAEDLLSEHSSTRERAVSSLNGRYVFVGLYLKGLGDEILSPVHGPLPGVIKHAVAFENLTTYGTDYFQPWPTIAGVSVDSLIEFGLLALAAFLPLIGKWIVSLGKEPETETSLTKEFAIAAGLFAIAGALLLTLALALVFAAHVEPINWLGLLGMSVLFLEPRLSSLLDRLVETRPKTAKGSKNVA